MFRLDYSTISDADVTVESSIERIAPQPRAADRPLDLPGVESFERQTDRLVTLGLQDSSASPRSLRLSSLTGGRIAVASVLKILEGGGVILAWEETDYFNDTLNVRSFVAEFDTNGALISGNEIELDRTISTGPYLAASGRKVFVLVQEKGFAVPVTVSMTKGFSERSIAPSRAVTDSVDPKIIDLDLKFDDAIAKAAGVRIRRAVPRDSEEILAAAAVMRDLKWVMSSANYKQPGIDNLCNISAGKDWMRPPRLDNTVGEEVRSAPYKWGGQELSDVTFLDNMAAGKLAGDVCTCRDPAHNYCLVSRAAGVDCSGFVSLAWGLGSHHGTSQLYEKATKIAFSQLTAGDAVVRPGKHVRLFVKTLPGAADAYATIESAVSCGGICEKVYTPGQLNKYKAIRSPNLKS